MGKFTSVAFKAVLIAAAIAACHSKASLSALPPDLQHIPNTKTDAVKMGNELPFKAQVQSASHFQTDKPSTTTTPGKSAIIQPKDPFEESVSFFVKCSNKVWFKR